MVGNVDYDENNPVCGMSMSLCLCHIMKTIKLAFTAFILVGNINYNEPNTDCGKAYRLSHL